MAFTYNVYSTTDEPYIDQDALDRAYEEQEQIDELTERMDAINWDDDTPLENLQALRIVMNRLQKDSKNVDGFDHEALDELSEDLDQRIYTRQTAIAVSTHVHELFKSFAA